MGRCLGVELRLLGSPKGFRRRDWMGKDRADSEFEKEWKVRLRKLSRWKKAFQLKNVNELGAIPMRRKEVFQ